VGLAGRAEKAARVKMEEKAVRVETVKTVSWDAMAEMVAPVEMGVLVVSEGKVETGA
jgi:hypothetical protein